ncbi:MAG: alpha/beta fold hydrolase [Pseudomonas sp.]
MPDITLLPGWALAPESMEPLRLALLETLSDARVSTHALPPLQLSSLETDLTDLAASLKPGVLVGWSLGGMLAVQLLRRFPERFSAVVTLASNACFVTRPNWPRAMPAEDFKAFYADARANPEKMLKRFALLVTQGSQQARKMARELQWDAADPEQRLHALALLAILDNRIPLSRPDGPVLHCLGGQDALVPAQVAADLMSLSGSARVRVLPQASHALPLEQPLWVAEQIAEFLQAGPASE